MAISKGTLRIAAVADIHCGRANQAEIQALLTHIGEQNPDVLLLCGDITEAGHVEEAEIFAAELRASIKCPVLGVLGNHDLEAGKKEDVVRIFSSAGVSVLDGATYRLGDTGFAGIKGFGGGFGRFQLQAWGEEVIKKFVQETLNEALHLESSLVHLEDLPRRIVLMHYSPIRATVIGEPPEIFPFLGSSHLEEPIDQFDVAMVFHGHAHAGTIEGHTLKNVPVYNVSLPVLRKAFPRRPPFRMVEIPGKTKL